MGSNVNISDVPAPAFTDTEYLIKCFKLSGTDTSCQIRSYYSPGQTANAAWYLISPQVYREDGGRIVARNIITEALAAISANLGIITGGELKGDANNYWSLDGTDGKTAGEIMIGDGNDNVFWYKPGVGLTIKTSQIYISAVGTSVKGNFYVEDNIDTNPPRLFDVNADNNTVTVGAAAQAAPLTVNGTIRVNAATESTGKDTGALVVGGGVGIGKSLNVGGEAGIAGALDVGGAVTAAMVVMTEKPSASGGTLLNQVSGYTKKNITLSAGWYWADIAGGGGGGGGPRGSTAGATGGNGGKLTTVFFVSYSVEAVLASGAGGSGGGDAAGGGGGGSSSLYIPELGIIDK
jgi:hypothetical protein